MPVPFHIAAGHRRRVLQVAMAENRALLVAATAELAG